MTERWESELQQLRQVAAPPGMRGRVAEGPHGDGMPPAPGRGQRVLAGVVAFAVFGAAVALALGAFGDHDVSVVTSSSSDVGASEGPDLLGTMTVPEDGSQPGLSLRYGSQTAAIHAQGGEWPDTSSVYTAELQSAPSPILPGTRVAFDGDWTDLSADVRYGMAIDSVTEPASLQADEAVGHPAATFVLPDVPGEYVITVRARWEQGSAEFEFLVTLRDPDALTVTIDQQTDLFPYVHAQYGDKDVELVPDVSTAELPEKSAVPQEEVPVIDVSEGTSIWVLGDPVEHAATLDATFGDTQFPLASAPNPAGPTLTLQDTPPGSYVLRVDVRWDQGAAWFLLGVEVAPLQAPPSGAPSPPPSVVVPSVTGMTEPEARQTLADVGLTLVPAYFFSDTVPDGVVTGTMPGAGANVAATTAVEVDIAAPGQPPPNGGGWVWLGRLQDAHPELIVGAERGPEGIAVIALNPGIDPVAAAPILHAALEGKPYSTISCPRSKTELDAVGTELQRLFESHQLDSNGYGGYIDVLSCTYLAEGGFPPDSVAALHARFGEALTIVDGLHMSLLMPEVSPTP